MVNEPVPLFAELCIWLMQKYALCEIEINSRPQVKSMYYYEFHDLKSA